MYINKPQILKAKLNLLTAPASSIAIRLTTTIPERTINGKEQQQR